MTAIPMTRAPLAASRLLPLSLRERVGVRACGIRTALVLPRPLTLTLPPTMSTWEPRRERGQDASPPRNPLHRQRHPIDERAQMLRTVRRSGDRHADQRVAEHYVARFRVYFAVGARGFAERSHEALLLVRQTL